jgi:hypothetical protein
MSTALEAEARGLDTHELDLGIAHECGERTDRVRAPADARDDLIRQTASEHEVLRASLVADHALELPHDRGEGVGPCGRAEEIEGIFRPSGPGAEGLVDRVLERAAAALDVRDLRAEHAHAIDVWALSLHVEGAHEDLDLHAEERADHRGGDAVLSGARLRDEPPLAEALGQQALAERVVGLVRAAVQQVLALEVERHAELARRVAREVERCRPPCVRPGEGRQPIAEVLVVPRLDPSRLDLFEHRDEELGDVDTPVRAEFRGETHPRVFLPSEN